MQSASSESAESLAPETLLEGTRPTGAAARKMRRAPFGLILTLFVFSGATGLIDQLCFSKYLSYVVGSTAHAVSAVLSAFMTGLALGAFLGGRYAQRVRRPLFAYGVLELVVAATVALAPLAFHALAPLYAGIARSFPGSLAALSAARWLSALLIVIVPTTAMGATLPLLSRLLPAAGAAPESSGLRERRLGALYASNTAGGALGALAAAYLILPALGMDLTVLSAAVGSALIGALAIYYGRHAPEQLDAPAGEEATRGPADARARRDARISYVVAAASGALVFSAEVIFTHLLALIIGNSAYAFGLILAAFLSCLFLGASRAERVRRRFGEAALPFGLVLTGLALVITLPLWDKLPLIFNNTGQLFTSFAAREATRGAIAFVVLAIPTVFMGLTFPLLLQRVAATADVSWWVGRLTTINTLGAVVGSLATGYLILPWLGSERALFAVALVFVAAGLLTTRFVEGSLKTTAYVLSFGTVAVGALLPRWDLARLTAGTNVYFEGWEKPEEVPFVRDDKLGGVTTVTKLRGVYTLYTNGKFQGNTGWEMNAQRFFAHYPSIFVSRFEHALVIGLGTGTTLGTIASYPWKKLELVEISPAIVEAADAYFKSVNGNALHDPRLTTHIADGRNFLLVDQRKYDLISMELSSIWFAGAASLYSREFYQLVKDHLAEGGIFQQWVQLHHVTRKDFATVVHTLRSEFPHVALFYGGGQGILVASMAPLRASAERVQGLQSQPAVLATTPGHKPLMELLDDVLVAGADLDRFLEDSARASGVPLSELVSTDGNLYLEYATPRGNVLPWSARDELVRKILEFRSEVSRESLSAP
ncbi:MAG TPA: fused MFS/spermidine synthase [Polyangiaceae bacterium]|nr:fused MFS/spermidine synthase [Polyangiaceae bacterium]